MTMRQALQIVLAISLFGAAFSGWLAYGELFGTSARSCPALGASGTVLGYPACMYGFFMYIVIAAIATAGLRTRKLA